MTGVRWRPGGSELASEAHDGTLRIWSVDRARSPATWLKTRGWVWHVGWISDGSTLAAIADYEIVLRDQTGAVRRPVEVESEAFGGSLAAARPVLGFVDRAGRFTIVDSASGGTLLTRKNEEALMGIALSSDAGLAAISSVSEVTIWSVPNGEPVLSMQARAPALAFSPDDGLLALAPLRSKEVVVIDIAAKRVHRRLPGLEPTLATWGLAWSHDGHRLAAASDDGLARVWTLAEDESPLLLRGHSAEVKGIAWDPANERLATASLDGTARVWNARTGQLLDVLSGHTSGVRTVAWSADGSSIATGAEDGTARLFPVRFSDVLTLAQIQMQVGLTLREREECLRRISPQENPIGSAAGRTEARR